MSLFAVVFFKVLLHKYLNCTSTAPKIRNPISILLIMKKKLIPKLSAS